MLSDKLSLAATRACRNSLAEPYFQLQIKMMNNGDGVPEVGIF